MICVAAVAGWLLWDYYMDQPWTRDGRVCADVVKIAPDVSGLVSEVLVRDNQTVRKGDVLFRVDRARFELALRQAEAGVANAQAALQLARRNLERTLKLQESHAAADSKADEAIASAAQCEAATNTALAARDVARLNLERSEIKAPVNGTLTNFSLREGNYVNAGVAVTALVDDDSFYVAGYFEETKLRRVAVGAPVRVRLMGGGELAGRVTSIARGIEDRERTDSTRLLANVNPTFSWVRLAQRVPVRVTLDALPQAVRLVAGQTATVVVR